MTVDDARANVSVYKNMVSLHRQEHGCSSELLRCSASNAGIEIKSIQRNVLALRCPSIIL